MSGYFVCTQQETMMSRFFKRFTYGGFTMLTQLFIDGRWNDPAYRERTWLRFWQRLWKRS